MPFEDAAILFASPNTAGPLDAKDYHQGIGPGKDIIKHHTPPSWHKCFHPSASERLGNVNHTEKGKAEKGQPPSPRLIGSGTRSHKAWYPGAHIFIYDYGSRVRAPIMFHDI